MDTLLLSTFVLNRQTKKKNSIKIKVYIVVPDIWQSKCCVLDLCPFSLSGEDQDILAPTRSMVELM